MTFWDRNKGWIIFFAIILLVGLLVSEARGQSCDGDYGCAQFYRSDAWPRDGLIEHFVLDPGVQGDTLNGDGDFESWTGAEGGCTDCPANWTCNCTSWGGDIDQETIHLYAHDSSLEIEPDGLLTGLVYKTYSFAANDAYQLSFCYQGEAGTEDFLVAVSNVALNDSYNWDTDTWTAPVTYISITNIGTGWTCGRGYITVGAVDKVNYLIAFAAQSADGTAIRIDNVRLERLNAVSVTGARGNILSVPVTSDQQWGHSEVAQPRVGTGPAGWWGMWLDGVDDYLSCDDGDCEMDPVNWNGGGYFSFGCRLITNTVAATVSMVTSKYAGAGTRSWLIRRSTADLEFFVSDDGTNTDSNSVTVFTQDALHSFVSTFDPSGGPGACENNIYYNAYQIDTDATMTECGPFDTAAALEVGSYNTGNNTWSGSIFECSLWEKELSAIEANKYISPYFPATNHGDGFYVDTCDQAASHATCSTQVCRDGTPNACQAEGTGVMALFDQYTELIQNNSFETNAGTDDNPTFTNWTVYAGAGTTDLTAYRADTIHGNLSARMSADGAMSYYFLVSDCIAVSGGDPYYAYLKARSLKCSGDCYFYVLNHEYTDGACTNHVHTHNVATEWPDVTWGEQGQAFTVDAAANSMKLEISVYCIGGGEAEVLVDTVSIKEASYRTLWVENPAGAGLTTYNSRYYILHNPLADYCQSEGDDCYADGFCASAWVYTDWAGNDGSVHNILYVPATVGSNNLWQIKKTGGNDLYFNYYDGAGVNRSVHLAVTNTNWTSAKWKYVEWCSNNSDNTVVAHHYNVNNTTWYDWGSLAGAGTGIQDGQSSELYIGHEGDANYCDCYQSEIHISPYSAIYPNIGFNGGIPPRNHDPY